MGPFIPAGMPPGTEYAADERPPEGVYYFRIYAAVTAFFYGALALLGIGMMTMPLFSSKAPTGSGPPAELGMWVAGLMYAGIGAVFAAPAVIALFGGRRPWVHTLGTVVIGLGMMSICCVPILIPVLIHWMKPETRAWYGSR